MPEYKATANFKELGIENNYQNLPPELYYKFLHSKENEVEITQALIDNIRIADPLNKLIKGKYIEGDVVKETKKPKETKEKK